MKTPNLFAFKEKHHFKTAASGRNGWRIFEGFLLLCAFVCCSGCAQKYTVLEHHDNLFVERIPSSRVYLADVKAEQQGGELVIEGAISRRIAAFSGMGHVDVAVVSPNGAVIHMASVSYEPKVLPKTPGARKHRPSHFKARLCCVPPSGSIIRLAFHGKPDPDDPLLDCDENLAVPKNFDCGG